MPELAEVALFARGLNQLVGKRKLTKVVFPNQKNWGHIVAPKATRDLVRSVCGSSISFCSVGKTLFLNKGFAHDHRIVEFRLGMTGAFQTGRLSEKWKNHCFLSLSFGDLSVHYVDPRRFGRIRIPSDNEHALGGFCARRGFWKSSTLVPLDGYSSKPRITWLLTTGSKTGIGNYMANEALGRLNLSPFNHCSNEREAILLLKKCSQVAEMSFKKGGNSFSSRFFDVLGAEGRFAASCKFYQNASVPKIQFRGRPLYTWFNL